MTNFNCISACCIKKPRINSTNTLVKSGCTCLLRDHLAAKAIDLLKKLMDGLVYQCVLYEISSNLVRGSDETATLAESGRT